MHITSVTMKILVLLCICATAINSLELSFKNFPTDVIKSSSPDYYANLILQKLHQNDTRAKSNVSNKCKGQLLLFVSSLLKLEDWAVNMFDASTKLPSGLLRGYASGLGSFDQCLNVRKETNSTGIIKGKYCLGAIPIVDLTPRPYQSENRMINLEDYKINLHWAMCLPDGCSADEFEKLSILPLKISTNSCQTADTQTTEYDSEDYCAMVFFGIVFVLMVLSTGYEAFNLLVKKENSWDIFYSFSVITNTIKIITPKNNNEEITCLHGMKVISLLFLTYGFTYATYMLTPLDNLLDIYAWLTDQLTSIYFEGILVVDTFFVISGMLVSYNYLNFREKRLKFNILSYYIARILRLSPALFAIVLLNGTLMRHMGSGPIWPLMKNTLLVNNCRENWWTTLLYIQNYVYPNYFTPIIVLLCWILAMGLIVLSFSSPGIVGASYDWVKNSLHLALIRIPWSIAIAWFIFACINKLSGPVNYILSAPVCQAISRISYCTFLTNTTVIAVVTLQTRRGVEFTNTDVLYQFWPLLVYTLTIGFVWTLAFEAPIIRIQKCLFSSSFKFSYPAEILQKKITNRFKDQSSPKTICTSL
ncbi:hypothetical protein RN001_012538 [Aquatica leii]|uniref:Nose resistant-to-fluoxetine protein N-terminal domain-containing protein n=1 Tax=Aquatica leii TaxID=1421715 RepID=A0AAN7P6C1_9COLE|nr:hypothetical protein RN001_012538 [Aquatica leii]